LTWQKRPKREKKEELRTGEKYTEENLGWRGWISIIALLSRSSSSSPFTDL
tara:strand:- start:93 stop:245 length:153 start_codon:yes stop_codon:yes gene_type:complete